MTLTRRTAFSLIAAALTAPALGGMRRNDFVDQARAALAPGGLVEGLIDGLAQQGRFSGVVLAAVEGRPLLHKACGLANRATGAPNRLDSRFNIASAGKMFTTVAIGQLIEAGRVGLDDPVARHIPDIRPDIGGRVTIRHLLTHSSGLGSYFASPLWNERRAGLASLDDFLALSAGEPLQFTPGERYEYSNSGFVLLGAVIQRVTGRDFYDAVQARVFDPAGMTGTGYPVWDDAAADLAIPYTNGCFMRPPDQCTPGDWQDARPMGGRRGSPAGGGVSTAGDLHRFVEALKGGRLLRPETLALMTAEQGRMTRQGGPIDAYGLGFGRLTVHGHPTWGHNGGTVGAQAQVDVFETGPLTLIVLSNQDGGQRPASSALRRAAAPPGWTPPPAGGAGPVMVRPGG